jgi:transcriptional regulator with XRE-family HTH domain
MSAFTSGSVCVICHTKDADAAIVPVPARATRGTAWLWLSPAAASALATRDLGVILRTYRAVNHVSQRQLAEQLGYDPAYISLLERGKRGMTDQGSLARIARHLAIPPHILGITDEDDADFTAMLQFADSTIRLAEIARRSGHAVDAVNELWPLIARLEARAASGRVERDVAILLVHARVAFGTSLGHILPEERLASAAYWTGKALRTAGRLGEHSPLAHVLRMHGNELRKAGYLKAGAGRLTQALTLSHSQTERGETLALFAARLANLVIQGCSTALSTTPPRFSTTPTSTRCCSTRSRYERSTCADSSPPGAPTRQRHSPGPPPRGIPRPHPNGRSSNESPAPTFWPRPASPNMLPPRSKKP